MNSGELLTRMTVWLALTLYVASELVKAIRGGREPGAAAWWLKAAGGAFFLGHMVGAFNYFYGWSHAAAYADTARQTKEFSGWDSGSGLYLNYLFALVWMIELICSRLRPANHSTRSSAMAWAMRTFILFMIFNGAFVFVRGHLRWFGLLLCMILVGCWWPRPTQRPEARPAPGFS